MGTARQLREKKNMRRSILTERVAARVLGHGEGAVGRGFPHVLVIVVVLGDHLLDVLCRGIQGGRTNKNQEKKVMPGR